ncbi:major facilitator superfamily domain-containing protein [Umbelopsis sp. AD052]|nr:major facilitator superfamily domain-containing protein [Umbelopsis sp. AD052]
MPLFKRNQQEIQHEEVVTDPVYRTYKIRYFGLTMLVLLQIVTALNWTIFAPAPQFAADYYNTSLSAINWFANVYLLCYLVSSPLSSLAFERYSLKFGIVTGAVLQLIGAWLRYFSTFVQNQQGKFALAMIGQILCALAQPFILNAPTPYAATWFTPAARATANMAGSISNPVGVALADLIIPALIVDESSLPFGLLIVACITTAVAIPTVFIPPRPRTPPSSSAARVNSRPYLPDLKLLLTNWNYLVLLFCFGTFVGIFNAMSTLLNQIVTPYGYSNDDAGFMGVGMIVGGLVGAIAMAIFVDKTKLHKIAIKISLFLSGIIYLILFFVVKADNMIAIMVICVLIGFLNFSALPVGLELGVECTFPVAESASSSTLWASSQILGLIFIEVMDALRYPDDQGDPVGNMRRALILVAVFALVAGTASLLYRSRNYRMESEAADALQQQDDSNLEMHDKSEEA